MPSLTLYALVATFAFGPGQEAKVPLKYFESPQKCVVASAKTASVLTNESTLIDLRCFPMPVNVQGPPQQEGRPVLPPDQRQREAEGDNGEAPPAHPHEEHL